MQTAIAINDDDDQKPTPADLQAAVARLAAPAQASTSSAADDHVQMPVSNQVGHGFLTPAVPQRKRAAQQPLPQRYQDAAPRINREASSSDSTALSSNDNSYKMEINVKRNIPRRTCFAV